MHAVSTHRRRKKPLHQAIVQELRRNLGLYALVAIPVIFLLIFKYWPMYGVQIAFRDYTPVRSITGSPWVGLKHIRRFFGNPQFWSILRNTFLISVYSLGTFPLSILFALQLHYLPSIRYRKTIQLVSYAPHFISTVVMVGILLQFLDKNSGLLNLVIKALGGNTINFMAKPDYFYSIYVWSGVWQGLGYSAIIYISALSGVPTELHEAAIVDGATIPRRIWSIDIPCILPTICILLIMNCGRVLSVGHEKIFLMQNNLNRTVSEVISTYVYKQGLASSIPQYSYGAAIDLFITLVNLVLLVTVNRVSRSITSYGLW
ncbi:MAG TPA: ABC transporter permease subunit [Clostridia bacterium]|nr:ABC transporter permease subunit [Clostridia bacterium]